jgi:hypothetical protein
MDVRTVVAILGISVIAALMPGCADSDAPIEPGTTWRLSKACRFVLDRPMDGKVKQGGIDLWDPNFGPAIRLTRARREGLLENPSNAQIEVTHDTAFRLGDLVIDLDRRAERPDPRRVRQPLGTYSMVAYGSEGTAWYLVNSREKAFELLKTVQCDDASTLVGEAARRPALSARLLSRNDRIVLQLVNTSPRDVEVGAQFPESPNASGHRIEMLDASSGKRQEGWKETLASSHVAFPTAILRAGQVMQREYARDEFLGHFLSTPACAEFTYAYRREGSDVEARASEPLKICREDHVGAAVPAADPEECRRAFLSADGDWRASAFNGAPLQWPTDQRPSTFTPIERIHVRNGRLYAKTWATEPVAAQLNVAGDQLRITPQYADYLGIDDAIGLQARMVQPYAARDVVHAFVPEGRCQSPETITIVFSPIEGGRRTVSLDKVPTVPIEFQEAAE